MIKSFVENFQKSKYPNIIGKLSLIVLFAILFYHIGYFLAEHLFFDKFFYRKSVTHGYLQNGETNFSKFGKRAQDIIWLQNKMKDQNTQQSDSISNTFNIAVIGDSVTWGQGIKNDERFPILLENRLNKIRKTKVYSYASVGDNFTQNYEKIKFLESIKTEHKIDLYILALVHNDAFVTISSRYLPTLSAPILESCNEYGDYIYNTSVDPKTNYDDYKKKIEEALNSPANNCLINKMIEELPSNLIIFETDNIFKDDPLHDKYVSIFEKFNIDAISPLPNLTGYTNPEHLFFKMIVSKTEGHPSVFANQVFSKTLYEEIIQNPLFLQKQ